jgi:hypothetical protein
MNKILNDNNTFKEISTDPTLEQENNPRNHLLRLKNNNFITETEYNYCRSVGSQPGRIYGLPKIHKTGRPLRPIVSATGTFNFKLAKLLAKKLDYLRVNKTTITNTFDFLEELHSLKFEGDKIKLISFDVTNLFTRVSLDRTIELITLKLYGPEHTCTYNKQIKKPQWCSNCKNRSEMKKLLDISTKDSHFLFNGKVFAQTNGIAMGSSLGPLFADIYMNHLESKLMKRLERNGVLYWRWFVDDIFTIVEKDTDIDQIIQILNSFDPDIIFTHEPEKYNTLPFLDIRITRIPTSKPSISTKLFTTRVYRKSTYTGLLTKWHSHVPRS